MSHETLDRLFRENPLSNIGGILGEVSGLVRIDVDSEGGEAQLAEFSGGDLPATWEFSSGKGRGLLYRIPPGVKVKTTPYKDSEKKETVRFQGEGAQTVLPPSRHPSGRRYAWKAGHSPADIDAAMMPPWLIDRLKIPEHKNGGTFRGKAAPPSESREGILKRARAYVEKMPPAISGQGGHDATFKVACRLLGGFGLSVDEARPIMDEYNERCEPPWTDAEVDHKLQDAEKQPGERGYLLKGKAFTNFFEKEIAGPKGELQIVKMGYPIDEMRTRLATITDGWPQRVGEVLFAPKGHEPVWLSSAAALFAWINGYTQEPVKWSAGEDKVSKEEFFAYLQQNAKRHDGIEPLPHYPSLPNHFYLHPEPKKDIPALGVLLKRFSPATQYDYDLMHAAFLTPFWGGKPGQRPAFLIESVEEDDQGGRGSGKTTLAKAISYLAGGHIDVRPTDDFSRVVSRLLTPSALLRRCGVLDNLKTLKFSWADLEALITNDTISGWQNYVGDGSRPNVLTWFITLNSANLSKDLAQRCVIVRVKRPQVDAKWEEETWRFIDEFRWSLIGDILAQLQTSREPLSRYSRWSAWEQGVLSCVAEPSECQALIVERQEAIDGDQEESDLVREVFVAELRRRGHNPDTEAVFISSVEAGAIVNAATGEKRPTNKASAYLRTLTIPELRKSKRDGRGFAWRGRNSPDGAAMTPLHPEPFSSTWRGKST